MKSGDSEYWFPAKQYGWGWGIPNNWQGWVVMLIFIASVVAGSIIFPPPLYPFRFAIWIIVSCLLLVVICYAKGEPPAWRWGTAKK
jgi:hypothetical protein